MNACAARRAGRTCSWAAITRPKAHKIPRTRGNRMSAPHSTLRPKPTPVSPANASPSRRPFKLIGELINNSFARAARAFKGRDIAAYAKLAKLQADLGADYLTLNIDGTQSMRVMPEEMYDFLPDLIPAIQEAT